MRKTQWVALVLLGGAPGDTEGAYDLCASIFHYEPEALCVLLVCDGEALASQTTATMATFGGRVIATAAPPKHPVDPKGKYLGPNVLYGLDMIESQFEGSFVLKLDTDSLLIGPFSERVHDFLDSNPKCGICGTLGRTSAREHGTYGYERRIISPLIQMNSSLPPDQWDFISSLTDADLLQYANDDPALSLNLRACSTIARPVQEAFLQGYRWLEYCQGGGYAISWPFLKEMRRAGYVTHARALHSLPTGEDVLLSMYCRSLGFRVMDYSDYAQPFACTWCGLPYAPDMLIQRQHAIIHSLKGNKHASREELQAKFQALRV